MAFFNSRRRTRNQIDPYAEVRIRMIGADDPRASHCIRTCKGHPPCSMRFFSLLSQKQQEKRTFGTILPNERSACRGFILKNRSEHKLLLVYTLVKGRKRSESEETGWSSARSDPVPRPRMDVGYHSRSEYESIWVLVVDERRRFKQ
jgi:hypothetical protein